MKPRNRNGRAARIEPLECRVLLSAAASEARAHPTFRLEHRAGLAPASTAGANGITPAQMLQAYGINNIQFNGITGAGAGQTIAIIDAYDDPNIATDLASFDNTFGIAAPPGFTKLNEYGGASLPGADYTDSKPNTWELEESLDVEWAHAIAPAASIILYEANSDSTSDLLNEAVNTARNNPNVSVISMSFSSPEFSGEQNLDSIFTTPSGHQGITFLAATGDTGSPGGYPAYSPNVVAVGGTTLSINSSGNWTNETAWNSSGGGTSRYEFEPTYQDGVQSTGRRTTPDVSMDANPSSGVPVFDSYDNGTSRPWIEVGGTSLATPMWAGLIAIADQGRAASGLGTLDGASQTLPMLYEAGTSSYHDIVSGSNGAFSAGPGYDEVTGIGTPVANLLMPALVGTATSSAQSIWNSSAAPAWYQQNINVPDVQQAGGATLGLKFQATVAGTVTGVQFWKGSLNTGVHTGQLWTDSGQLLASATFTNETASGWQQVSFSTPVAINANTTYIVSYNTTAAYIAYTPYVLSSPSVQNGSLLALQNGSDGNNGIYQYDSSPGVSAFPSLYNGQAPTYWVDVIFSPASVTNTTASSIFSASLAPDPSLQNLYDSDIVAAGGVDLGLKFQSDVSGYITGVSYWKGSQNTGVHTGQLWSDSGQLLASATFTNESSSGWQQVSFATPVAISANTTYIIAYHTTSAFLAYTPWVLQNSGVTNLTLTALQNGADGGNAVYGYDSSPGIMAFPDQYNGQAPSYWVDVVFSATI